MLAVILTGIVLGGIGTSYVILFAASAVVCTSVVELRGLFLTVVLYPFYWFFGVTAAGVISGSSDVGGGRTLLLTSAYPAIENFLWLAVTFAVCLVIGIARWRVDVAALEAQRRRDRARRRRLHESEASNQKLNARMRGGDGADAHTESADHSDRTGRPARPQRRGSASGAAHRAEASRTPRSANSPRSPRRAHGRPETRGSDLQNYPRYPTTGRGQNERKTPGSGESRTRTAAELREASRRRRSRSQDRPLDME